MALAEQGTTWSNQAIADRIGINNATVRAVRLKLKKLKTAAETHSSGTRSSNTCCAPSIASICVLAQARICSTRSISVRLGAALQAMAAQGIAMKYDTIHHVLGEGNFVLVVSEGNFGGQHTSFYDLFRVEHGKIAEHWDTIEPIPLRGAWQNDNGKF